MTGTRLRALAAVVAGGALALTAACATNSGGAGVESKVALLALEGVLLPL